MLKKLESLHKLCFPGRPWTASDFAELKKSGCEIVASENGFIVWRTVADETEVITIGVAPDARGTGISDALLVFAEQNAKVIFLEVSENNIPAIKLYERNGYKKIGLRKKYYSDGSDAVVMRKQIQEPVHQK